MTEPTNTYNQNSYEQELNSFVNNGYDNYDSEEYYDAEGDEEDDDLYEEDGDGEEYQVVSKFGGEVDQEQEDLDDYVYDIDFSQFNGSDFKSSLNGVNRTVNKKRSQRTPVKRVIVPKGRKVIVEGNKRPSSPRVAPRSASPTRRMVKPIRSGGVPSSRQVPVQENQSARIIGNGRGGTTKRIIVPSSQKVIVEGVDKFILSKGKQEDNVKNIGYYKGKKLRELILTMNNNSALDFNVELFNPSEPLDYLFSTSGNLNNKIQVAGDIVSYSDVLFNILANPTHLVNAKFTFSGATYQSQINQPLIFKNKRITGEQLVEPMQLALKVDNMQVIQEIVFFDIYNSLNRPFIPNGMDVIQYKVLAGNTVTFAFYYEQKDLRKFFFKEARESKKLL
ncbi:MAG: hypothetical protein WCI04_00065 [archaeon]